MARIEHEKREAEARIEHEKREAEAKLEREKLELMEKIEREKHAKLVKLKLLNVRLRHKLSVKKLMRQKSMTSYFAIWKEQNWH